MPNRKKHIERSLWKLLIILKLMTNSIGYPEYRKVIGELEKLHSLGYEYLYEPFDLNGKGTKIAFIQDPDGYEIELIEKVVW